jgi:hypothetical protein
MLELQIEENPNCSFLDTMVFQVLEEPQPVVSIRVDWQGQSTWCEITGVAEKGKWVPAKVQKVADSGEGEAYLIYGAEWGVRLNPQNYIKEPWSLTNPHQWGETHKIYAQTSDIRL